VKPTAPVRRPQYRKDPVADGNDVFGGSLYDGVEGADDAPVQASLGCGVPTAVADLHDGDVVLDLGSGAGADVLISARRVAPSGRAIGLDMTDLARSNAAAAGVTNAEFVTGYLEQLPLADASVDVVISNCVINLSGDKPAVLREAARVLRPGGRFAISDVIADTDMDDATRADVAAWTGCVAGALTREEFERLLADAGLADVEIRETHGVHERAAAAHTAGSSHERTPMRRECQRRLIAISGRRTRWTATNVVPRRERSRSDRSH
jgi:SAM-dependent methyltransferase